MRRFAEVGLGPKPQNFNVAELGIISWECRLPLYFLLQFYALSIWAKVLKLSEKVLKLFEKVLKLRGTSGTKGFLFACTRSARRVHGR